MPWARLGGLDAGVGLLAGSIPCWNDEGFLSFDDDEAAYDDGPGCVIGLVSGLLVGSALGIGLGVDYIAGAPAPSSPPSVTSR